MLPSLFEGVPLVGIEAQFADLPCFFSEKVPTEVAFSDKTNFISLNQSAKEWARDCKCRYLIEIQNVRF